MTYYTDLLKRHTIEQLKLDALSLESKWPLDAAKIYALIADRLTESQGKQHYQSLARYFEILACKRA